MTLTSIARLAETRFAGFFAKNNLHLATRDNFSHLICSFFPDSKITQGFSKARKMQTSLFSLSSNAINDQNVPNMNPVTVRLFCLNNHKTVNYFFGMRLSTPATAIASFQVLKVLIP